MRRALRAAIALVTTAVLAVAPTTTSADPAGGPIPGGWVPAPQGSFDLPARARCDFPIHSEPVVDEVQKLTVATYPDRKPKREIFKGDLINEITRTDTGASTQADASGMAFVSYATDGSQTWFVVGPVLLGFRDNAGTLPRGLWIVDGVFTVQFSPDLIQKTITMVHGTTHNVCTDLD